MACTAAAVTLQSGRTTECSVDLPPCREVPIELVPDAGVFGFGMMRVLVHGSDGQLRYCGRVFTQSDGSIASTFHLPVGDYTFTAIGAGDSRGTAGLTVPAVDAVHAVRIALHPPSR
jgi:hypothetical protein